MGLNSGNRPPEAGWMTAHVAQRGPGWLIETEKKKYFEWNSNIRRQKQIQPQISKNKVCAIGQGFSQRCTNHLLVQRIEETQIIQFLKVLELVRNYSLILANIVVTQ